MIDETRAERDAFRMDPANWDKIDPANVPDRARWHGPPQPWTADELARMEADPSDEWDPPGDAVASGESWTDQVRRPDDDRTYQSIGDVREALLSGEKDVGEVRRDLIDQAPEPTSEPTTELVRTEGDYRYELGTRKELPAEPELGNDEASKRERLAETAKKRETIENGAAAGDHYVSLAEDAVAPRPTGTHLGTQQHPVVYTEARPLDGSSVVLAPFVLLWLGNRALRSGIDKVNEWKQSKGDKDDAGN